MEHHCVPTAGGHDAGGSKKEGGREGERERERERGERKRGGGGERKRKEERREREGTANTGVTMATLQHLPYKRYMK